MECEGSWEKMQEMMKEKLGGKWEEMKVVALMSGQKCFN